MIGLSTWAHFGPCLRTHTPRHRSSSMPSEPKSDTHRLGVPWGALLFVALWLVSIFFAFVFARMLLGWAISAVLAAAWGVGYLLLAPSAVAVVKRVFGRASGPAAAVQPPFEIAAGLPAHLGRVLVHERHWQGERGEPMVDRWYRLEDKSRLVICSGLTELSAIDERFVLAGNWVVDLLLLDLHQIGNDGYYGYAQAHARALAKQLATRQSAVRRVHKVVLGHARFVAVGDDRIPEFEMPYVDAQVLARLRADAQPHRLDVDASVPEGMSLDALVGWLARRPVRLVLNDQRCPAWVSEHSLRLWPNPDTLGPGNGWSAEKRHLKIAAFSLDAAGRQRDSEWLWSEDAGWTQARS